MMLQTPMLAKQPPVPTTEATLITTTTTTTDVLEPKATSLRRAATALLFFGMLCARPSPSSWGAWLAMIAAVTVLCAPHNKLLCRARFSRFVSLIVAIFAGYAVVSLVVSFRSGMPLQIADKAHGQCMDLPAETFAYAQSKLSEHKCLQKGLSFLSRHTADDPTSTPPALLLVSAENATAPLPTTLSEPKDWTQPVACDKIARFAGGAAKMMLLGSALSHLLLFLSAVAVVKRACRLRCAAYRAGVLEWKCGGAGCKMARFMKRAEPAATEAPVAAAKEMA